MSSSIYDEVEIEDFDFDAETSTYFFPCPCGDKFRITREELLEGEDIARCPSCSLLVRVIFDPEDLDDDGFDPAANGQSVDQLLAF